MTFLGENSFQAKMKSEQLKPVSMSLSTEGKTNLSPAWYQPFGFVLGKEALGI